MVRDNGTYNNDNNNNDNNNKNNDNNNSNDNNNDNNNNNKNETDKVEDPEAWSHGTQATGGSGQSAISFSLVCSRAMF